MQRWGPVQALPPEIWAHILGLLHPCLRPLLRATCRTLRDAVDHALPAWPLPAAAGADNDDLGMAIYRYRHREPRDDTVVLPQMWTPDGMYGPSVGQQVADLRVRHWPLDSILRFSAPLTRPTNLAVRSASEGRLDLLRALRRRRDPRRVPSRKRRGGDGRRRQDRQVRDTYGDPRVRAIVAPGTPAVAWSDPSILREALRCGSAPTVAWLRSCGCPMDRYAWILAARGGDVSVLRGLRPHPRDTRPDLLGMVCEAAEGGHLPMVAHLVERRGARVSFSALEWATQGGHLHVLRWVDAHPSWQPYPHYFADCYADLALTAAAYGHLPILQWLHESGHDFDVDRCIRVAARHPRCVEWLLLQALEEESQEHDRLLGVLDRLTR